MGSVDARPFGGRDTLVRLQEALAAFYRDRDWEQFQTLKDLAAGIAIEAGELQQLFLWRNDTDSQHLVDERRAEVEAEFADVFIHCLNFARRADIDIDAAVRRKLAENETKYPVAAVRGRVAPHGADVG